MKKILSVIIVFILCLSFISTGSINTQGKQYLSAKRSTNINGTVDPNVSTRELAMLASLVYEKAPNRCGFDGSGNVKSANCFYKENELEGFTAAKRNSAIGVITSTSVELGQYYYFINYANVSELENDWEIVNARSKKSSSIFQGGTLQFDDEFYATTYHKKGTNKYVIAYRGTDYPDLLEWVEDVIYALNGSNNQAISAYQYAQEMYQKIKTDSKDNAEIYVTGHSLGAYLAQVGGAAIVDYEVGLNNAPEGTTRKNTYTTSKDFNSLSEYTNYYGAGNSDYVKNSKLKQVAYFNGMGVSAIFKGNFPLTQNIDNALTYLGTHNVDGTAATSSNNKGLVNYSGDRTKIYSSGRLVLYTMDGDPVSNIGFHYGQIYRLTPGADAIQNHNGTHTTAVAIGNLFAALASQENSNGLAISQVINKLKGEQKTDKHIITALGQVPNLFDKISGSQGAKIILDRLDKLNSSSEEIAFVPKYVKNSVISESGKSSLKFEGYKVRSLLSNLLAQITTFNSKYGLKPLDLVAWANIAHETDSFLCLRDDATPDLTADKVTITIDDSKMHSSKGIYYITKLSDSIILKANVNNSCVEYNGYTWIVNGKTYKNKTNTLKIPFTDLGLGLEGSSKKVNISLKLTQKQNSYKEIKSKLVSDYKLTYSENTPVNTNPTKMLVVDYAGSVPSSKTVNADQSYNLKQDMISPVCVLKTLSISVKKGNSFNQELIRCTDVSDMTFSNISKELKKSFLKIKHGFENVNIVCNNSQKTCNITGKAIKSSLINNLVADNSETFKFSINANDVAGHTSKVSYSISLKRK